MKKLIASAACFAVIILMFTSMCTPAYAAEFNQKSLDGVVFIFWQGWAIRTNDEGNPILTEVGISGSGFFVGKEGEKAQYIITNYHVVQDFLDVDDVVKYNADTLANYYGNDVYNKSGKTLCPLRISYDNNDYEEAYIVDYDVVKDLAIIKIAKPTEKRIPLKLRESSDDLIGKSVWAVGYPGVADEIANSVTSYGKNDATVTVGSINRIITESGTGTTVYQTDAKVRSGNSGGPLVDDNGCVLGINTRGANDWFDTNLNYAVSIDDLIPLLVKNNVEYSLYPDLPDTTSFWGKCLPFFIGGGVLIIIIIVAVVLGSRKKTAPIPAVPLASAAEPVIPMQAPVLQPVLHSMSSQHGGMTIQLSRQPIIIGRDVSSCRIVFKDGTNGVSSKHCQIYYDEASGGFVLLDLKSTYGTFLSNGQKLTPGVPYVLKAKDAFYLGEADNVLYVDLEKV